MEGIFRKNSKEIEHLINSCLIKIQRTKNMRMIKITHSNKKIFEKMIKKLKILW